MARGRRPTAVEPLRILIVEDNPDDAEITRLAALRTLPCRVDVVGDGEAAVARLTGDGREAETQPDMILLDLQLPRMSGLEVLRELRRSPACARTPIVILTTSADDDDTILESYAAGASSFLAKPATDAGFAEALRTLAAAARRPDENLALTGPG